MEQKNNFYHEAQQHIYCMYTDPLGIVQQHFYRDIIKSIIISSIFLWFESTDAQSKGVLKKWLQSSISHQAL